MSVTDLRGREDVKKTKLADRIETRGERCKLFWEHLIARHPIEWSYAKPTKLAYRWREIPELRLVITQYVSFSTSSVGVFIRGERGTALSIVRGRLKPFVKELKKALRSELDFFGKRKNFDTDDVAKWDAMADWLHRQADAYEDALRRTMRRRFTNVPKVAVARREVRE